MAERYGAAVPADAGGGMFSTWNRVLRQHRAGFSFAQGPRGDVPVVLDGTETVEWGTLLVPSDVVATPTTAAELDRAAAVVGDPGFIAGLSRYVARLCVVTDDRLYPYLVFGRRAFGRAPAERPEVVIHLRFLANLTPGREARLFRAIVPRGERRMARREGRRTWTGHRCDAGQASAVARG